MDLENVLIYGEDDKPVRPITTANRVMMSSGESLEHFTEYSLEEKVIGKWIDGKLLYRKTISGELSHMQIIQTDVSDLVNSYGGGSYISEPDVVNPIPFTFNYGGNSHYRLYAEKVGTNLRMQIQQANSTTNAKVNFTIEYTKTTD